MPVLRALTYDDLDLLVEVQCEGAVAGLGDIFHQHEHPFPTSQVRARWVAEIEDPGINCFAIVSDGELAGFVATRGNEFLRFGTAVRTWGSGLADAAHGEVLEHLRAQGHQSACLRVFEDNLRAVRFYQRRGWRATDSTSRTSFPPFPVLRRYEIALAEADA